MNVPLWFRQWMRDTDGRESLSRCRHNTRTELAWKAYLLGRKKGKEWQKVEDEEVIEELVGYNEDRGD